MCNFIRLNKDNFEAETLWNTKDNVMWSILVKEKLKKQKITNERKQNCNNNSPS